MSFELLKPSAVSNPNLIVNGDFQVWQEGEEFTNIANKYVADIWYIGNVKNATPSIKKVNLTKDTSPINNVNTAINITETNEGINTGVYYRFEKPIYGKYTLSFYAKADKEADMIVNKDDANINLGSAHLTTEWKRFVFTIEDIDSFFVLYIPQVDITMTGFKLEIGDIATAFVSRSYQEELLACQRFINYIQLISSPAPLRAGNIIEYISTFEFSTPMRTIPTTSVGKCSIGNVGVNLSAPITLLVDKIDRMSYFYITDNGKYSVTNGDTNNYCILENITLDARIY